MRVSDLQKLLTAVDEAAVVVPPRVLQRIIRQAWNLPSLRWSVPHRKCFVVERHLLFRHVDQNELDLDPQQLLPPVVMLLSRPPVEKLGKLETPAALLKYWSRLFHVSVDRELRQARLDGRLNEAVVQSRIEEIGQAEFEEVRTVLEQDNFLPNDADAITVYAEFVAVYLEMRFFTGELLTSYFPSLRDFPRIDALVRQDVDGPGLFERTRLKNAPDPLPRGDDRFDESHDYFRGLVRSGERAFNDGNVVRSAILRMRAARVAPAKLTTDTLDSAHAALRVLTVRLKKALGLGDHQRDDWTKSLAGLLDKADQGHRPVEAALLFDLQEVCLDHEKPVYALDLVEFLLTAGKRPIKRPLPSQELVRIIRHLRSAAQRLVRARLSDADRDRLAVLLHEAQTKAELGLRERFRPLLGDAIQDAGLRPSDPASRAAFDKLVEELLDRIIEYGFLTFGDLRDTISRNQLKLADLTEPQDFIRGDALLQLDRRLAVALDGVYRRSEFYTRWLQRLSALFFGTQAGRIVTWTAIVPFGGAFLGIEAIDRVAHLELSGTVRLPIEIATGFFLFALMHRERFRRHVADTCRQAGNAIWFVLVDGPLRTLEYPPLRRALASWPVQLAYWFLLKPALLWAAVWLLVPLLRTPPDWWRAWFRPAVEMEQSMSPDWAGVPSWWITGFLIAGLIVNSRFGSLFLDVLGQVIVNVATAVRSGVFIGILRLVTNLFKRAVDMVEYVLFTADEWLRFRSGDGPISLLLRLVLGLLWAPIAYVARFYLVVLIEPGFNPVKFPISAVAAKLMLPVMPWLTMTFAQPLLPIFGPVLGNFIAVATVFFLPDAFGFLVWETKENMNLYAANRPHSLQPVVIGSHGETMAGLLRPGIHSGTIPALFARLRKAEREASRSGDWRQARNYRHELDGVRLAVTRFVERELVAILRQAQAWNGPSAHVATTDITLSSNRIRIDLAHPQYGGMLRVEFEERAGFLLARIRDPSWLVELPADQLQAFRNAMIGFYKAAGADLVEEHLLAGLPPWTERFEIVRGELVLRADGNPCLAINYRLRDPADDLRPRPSRRAIGWPALPAPSIIFARQTVSWNDWAAVWAADQAGKPVDLLPDLPLLPRSLAGPPPSPHLVRHTEMEDACPCPTRPTSNGAIAPDASAHHPL